MHSQSQHTKSNNRSYACAQTVKAVNKVKRIRSPQNKNYNDWHPKNRFGYFRQFYTKLSENNTEIWPDSYRYQNNRCQHLSDYLLQRTNIKKVINKSDETRYR